MDGKWFTGVLFLVLCLVSVSYEWDSVVSNLTADEMLDKCLDGIYHKNSPGAELNLHGQCAPWSDRSCCFSNVSEAIHEDGVWHDISWYHCGPQALSDECHRFMVQDTCFYECSPNVGPWLVEHQISIRNERFVDVPLCASECSAWWNACRGDMTCSGNWAKGWDWSTGTATCPEDKECKTIEEYFHNATNFCQQLWGNSFEVVPDYNPSKPCMKLFWADGAENPNDEVAQYYANTLAVGTTESVHTQSLTTYLIGAVLLAVLQSH